MNERKGPNRRQFLVGMVGAFAAGAKGMETLAHGVEVEQREEKWLDIVQEEE